MLEFQVKDQYLLKYIKNKEIRKKTDEYIDNIKQANKSKSQ